MTTMVFMPLVSMSLPSPGTFHTPPPHRGPRAEEAKMRFVVL